MDITLYPREFVPGQPLIHQRWSGGKLGRYENKLFAVMGTCHKDESTAVESLDLDNEADGWKETGASMPFAVKQ